MSVICQNFVQNAWKKDLCSNCFKSLSDHETEPTLLHPCIVESPIKNGLGPHQINARYVSQATTIYHSRGFLNHAAWKSLISDRQDVGNGYLFKLENGFHSKLLSISSNELEKSCCQNGNKVFTSIMKSRQRKMGQSVGFKDEDPLIIGYGGNDYESDENDWEMGSDDGDFPLGSLDVTPEDRAITKITKENTEFNSKNDNLLKGGCVASCFTNGSLSNGLVGQHTTEGSPTAERVKNKDDDVRAKVETSPQQTENSGRKLLNGISSSQCRRKEFPPRASVKPILREEPAKVKGHQEDKVRCEPVNNSDVRTEYCSDSPRNSTTPQCDENSILDEVGIIHESVIVLVDSNDCPTAEMSVSEISEPSDPNVTARKSFLHGMGQEETPFSAIYTPGNNDLFVSKTSSSSEDPTDESDTGSDPPHSAVTPQSEQKTTPNAVLVKPPKPARSTIAKKDDCPTPVPESTTCHFENEVTVTSNPDCVQSESPISADKSIYYAVSNPLGQLNAENNIYQEVGTKQNSDRVSKLAALAQELEQARCPGSSKRQAPAPPKQSSDQLPVGSSSSGPPSLSPMENVNHFKEPASSTSTKIYGFPFELKTKSATMSSVQGKKVLAILNFDDNGNASNNNNNSKGGKKGKFSIKKFLKRGKDMESIDQIFQNHNNTPNPKAWKQADFDRSKLRLEILHPMDLANKNHEPQSSSTEESSSFTDSDTNQDGLVGTAEELTPRNDGIYDDEFTWQSSPDSSQLGLVTQFEGANQSADLSIGFASLSTSTCSSSSSVMPSNPSSPTDPSQALYSQYKNNARPVRPPKPPPPPRLRSVMPNNKNTTNGKAPSESLIDVKGEEAMPAVPQKPQVPKRLYKQNFVSDYANLGDIRSNMAPRKPERSAITNHCSQSSSQEEENQYEPVGDYDNQLYQDTSELYEERLYCEPPNESHYCQENSVTCPVSLKEGPVKISSNETSPYWKENDRVTLTIQPACAYDRKSGDGPNRPPPGCGGERLDASAWLSLEQSYAIVAAANHEVLAKLLDQVMHQKCSSLQKPDGQNLQWADFYLQPSHPMKTIGEKLIYNAVQRHIPQRQVTLVATLQSASPAAAKETTSKHLLGSFTDELPKCSLPTEWLSTKEGTQASIYILPKTDISSIQSSFIVNRIEKNHPSSYEKDVCFVTLQLIQALKILQAHGTEEVDLNVENLILAKDDKDQMSHLVLLSADMGNEQNSKKMTLCQCAVTFLEKISNNNCLDNSSKGQPGVGTLTRKVFATVARVLVQEKASSLSRARQLLEYYLWGPKDQNSQPLYVIHRAEDTLQRWLDIERAHSLRLLVRSHKNISAFEEHQLQFLVRTNAVNLKDLAHALIQ